MYSIGCQNFIVFLHNCSLDVIASDRRHRCFSVINWLPANIARAAQRTLHFINLLYLTTCRRECANRLQATRWPVKYGSDRVGSGRSDKHHRQKWRVVYSGESDRITCRKLLFNNKNLQNPSRIGLHDNRLDVHDKHDILTAASSVV
jgi:hypothetical protein